VNFLRNPWLGVITRLVVGGIFVYASLDKVTHPDAFARIVFNYHLVPAPLINLIALVLPMVELVSGVLLILGVWPRSAGLILLVLTAVFILALSVNWVRGVSLECGCFSVSSKVKGTIGSLILRDLLLLAAAVQTTFLARPRLWLSADRQASP
jgi:uncharacterized membrane protein YphA (DoxX/SURF4 family)